MHTLPRIDFNQVQIATLKFVCDITSGIDVHCEIPLRFNRLQFIIYKWKSTRSDEIKRLRVAIENEVAGKIKESLPLYLLCFCIYNFVRLE